MVRSAPGKPTPPRHPAQRVVIVRTVPVLPLSRHILNRISRRFDSLGNFHKSTHKGWCNNMDMSTKTAIGHRIALLVLLDTKMSQRREVADYDLDEIEKACREILELIKTERGGHGPSK